MVRRSKGLLTAIDDDLRGIWCTTREEYDRVINIREEELSEEERETRRDNLRRLELMMSVARADPEDIAVLTLISP